MKKSRGVKSGERESQATGPPRAMQLFEHILFVYVFELKFSGTLFKTLGTILLNKSL